MGRHGRVIPGTNRYKPLIVVLEVEHRRDTDLPQVRHIRRISRVRPRLHKHGKKYRDQKCDDRDNDEQFD
jgi:hypothetical protein